MKIDELKNESSFSSYDYSFNLSIDNISYFLLLTKSERTGIKIVFVHREDNCHVCKGEVKRYWHCFNLFTLELYRDIVEYMLSSPAIRVRLLTTYHDLYEALKEELAFIHELEEEYQ
jgi:hypothetical protein